MTAPSPRDRRSSWTALLVSCAARLVLGTLAVLLAVSVVPGLVGWQPTVVMSGSMAPAIDTGDLVVVRPAEPADIAPGDVVLVDDPDLPGQLRLHRVVSVEDGGRLQLRGDANPAADGSLVEPAAVHGVGAIRLPAIGLPAVWLGEGRAVPLVLTGAGLLALLALAGVYRRPEEDERPRSRRSGRAAAPAALAVLGAVWIAGPGVGDALAVFTATTSNPASSLTAAPNWTCTAAATGAGAAHHYPLQESGGTVAVNRGSAGTAANGVYSSTGVTYGVPGPRCGSGASSAVRFDGVNGAMWTTQPVAGPQTFSVQAWFATTTTTGGKLIGFGNGADGGASGTFDRHVYMTDGGQLVFGVYNSTHHTITSPAAYNDGRWHLVTATFSASTGMTLYVDGAQVAQSSATTAAETNTGYWRVGYDNLGSWPGRPTSDRFAGAMAAVSVFGSALPASAVAAQYDVGPWSCATAAGPSGAGALQYLPLQEGAGTVAANAGSAGSAGNGTYASGGVTYRVAGPQCGGGVDAAVRLDGVSGQIWTTRAMTGPQWFTVQIWFATTTTRGGKLIGFGGSTSGAQSSTYDRHVYMTTAGRLRFGVYNGGYFTVASPGAYNDGGWHLATATFSPGTGMALYVDGVLVGSSTATTAAENATGYWRIGYDNLGSWPDAPTSNFFAGSLAHAVVVPRVLTADEVAGQYAAAR
ncbi:signal peptidase I [Blastococcus sp. SYSU D00820]